MEEASKRQRQENDLLLSFSAEKRPRPGDDVDGEGVMAWLPMVDDDGRVSTDELMNLLDSVGELTRVKFIDNPYSSTLIFQSSSSYVTINGNEESCGSSFSDSESSVMVSVDRGGIAKVGREEEWEVGAWVANREGASGWMVEEDEDGCGVGLMKGGVKVGLDGSDLDDYVLARFLVEDHSAF